MNKTISTKYAFAPETIERRSLNLKDSPYFNEIMILLDWKKLKTKTKIRNAKYNQEIDRRKRTLRSSLNLSEKVFVFAERLKKKDTPSKLFKASTKNMPFFNRNWIFTIYKRAKLNDGSYLYWVEEDGKK